MMCTRFRLSVALFAGVILSAGTTPALASTVLSTDSSPQIVAVHQTPMTLQHQVSALHRGTTVVVTLDNGAKFSIPAAEYDRAQQRAAQVVQPQDTAFGDCGYSYTYLYDWGNRQYRLAVGFHVDSSAVDYYWDAEVQGAGSHRYNYHYSAGGGLAWRSDWAGGHTGTVPAPDFYDADTTDGRRNSGTAPGASPATPRTAPG